MCSFTVNVMVNFKYILLIIVPKNAELRAQTRTHDCFDVTFRTNQANYDK